MLSQAVREVATWNAEALNSSPLFVSVNLSARQLADPHLVELVTRALSLDYSSPGGREQGGIRKSARLVWEN
jgi:EAL domain-containing protein (putative c-di-GMP-specific phosphodiesterase class I)